MKLEETFNDMQWMTLCSRDQTTHSANFTGPEESTLPARKLNLFWIKSDWFIQRQIYRPANWRFSKKIYNLSTKGLDL